MVVHIASFPTKLKKSTIKGLSGLQSCLLGDTWCLKSAVGLGGMREGYSFLVCVCVLSLTLFGFTFLFRERSLNFTEGVPELAGISSKGSRSLPEFHRCGPGNSWTCPFCDCLAHWAVTEYGWEVPEIHRCGPGNSPLWPRRSQIRSRNLTEPIFRPST